MAHVSLNDLARRLTDAGREVEVGARYVHYKNPTDEYIVKQLAILESTEEVAVLYEAQYDTRISFIRPIENFCEVIDVQGVPTPRFTKI